MKYLLNPIENMLIIDKSKFICNLYPVDSLLQIDELLKSIKKTHRDANHHCYAYIFDKQSLMKASDDGEPQKTAGIPMLEILKHHDLTDVLAIVTRYFGGIKLGAGGLIRAYASSVSSALQDASFATKLEKKVYLVQVPYALYDSFIYQTKDLVTILEQNFEINVAIKLYLNQITIETLTDQFNGQLTIEQLDIITVYDPLE